MKPKDMLAQLETMAVSLGAKVSFEALSSSLFSGGLCRVKDSYRIILDKRLGEEERVATLASSLAKLAGARGFGERSAMEIDSEVWSLLDYYSLRQAS